MCVPKKTRRNVKLTPIIARPEATVTSDILIKSGRVNDDVRHVYSTNRIFELFLLCLLGIQP